MEQKRIERQTLWVIFSVNILLAVSACRTYASTGIQAIFLDAGFSILLVLSTVAALVISKISGTTSRRFPEGRYWLEPLYALFPLGSVYLNGLFSTYVYKFNVCGSLISPS
uniref:cation transporter n=1 Tax=Paenibacillus sp. FSL L8-0436 TaxID=2954686 RepID=UPI00406CD0F7